jgi:hypothetical protein
MLTPAEQDEIRNIRAICQLVIQKTEKLLPETGMRKTKREIRKEIISIAVQKQMAKLLKNAINNNK